MRAAVTPITLTHGFVGQSDLARRLTDLVGTTGVLRAPTITHMRGLVTAKDTIAVTVDLRRLSTGIQSDAPLAKRLAAAGVDVKTLDAQLRSQLGHALTLEVTVHAVGGQSKTVLMSAGKQATVVASTSQTYTGRRDVPGGGRVAVGARAHDHGRVDCVQVAPASYVMNILPLPKMTNPCVVVVKPMSVAP